MALLDEEDELDYLIDEDLPEVVIEADRSPIDNNRLQAAQDAAIANETQPPKVTLPTRGESKVLPGLKSELVREYMINKAKENPNISRKSLANSFQEPDRADLLNEIYDNDRKQLVQGVQDADSNILSNIFAGLAGFGAGVAKRDVGAAFKQAKDLSTSGANRALAEFDNAQKLDLEKEDRALRGKEFKIRSGAADRAAEKHLREQQQFRNNNDPNSNKSRATREFLIRSLKITDPETIASLEGKSFADLEESTPLLVKQFDQTWDEKKHGDDLKLREHESKSRLAMAAAGLGVSQAQLQLAVQSAARADAASAGKVDNIETSRGVINYKEPKEQDKMSDVQEVSRISREWDRLARKGVIADATGLWDSGVTTASAAFKNLTKDQQDYIRLRTQIGLLQRNGLKSEPNSTKLQDEVQNLFNPNNDEGIPAVGAYLRGEVERIDPSGIYREGNLKLQERNKQGDPLPTSTNSKPKNTDPTKGPTNRIPLGYTVRDKKTNKEQIMTATGLKDK